MMSNRIWKGGLAALASAFLLAQSVQPDRTNPPANPAASFEAVAKPPHDVAAAIGRACHDCHSNQTAWPWYSRIAPVSWMIAADVRGGRAKLNFSEWNIYGPEMTRIKLAESCRKVTNGDMPPHYYRPFHSESKLTPAESAAICSAPVAQARPLTRVP
jgi:hypothetical protein